jgi:hypothetical protein
MYFGHYGVGLTFKKFNKRLSIGWLFLAVQFVDILAMVLFLLGIERANVVPGFAASSSIEYVYFPFSHSLVAFLVWTAVFYVIFRLVRVKPDLKKSRVAVVMALGVLSHFVLDVVVHTPDMSILGGDSFKMGLGLWNYHPAINYIVEGAVLLVGLFLYLKTTKGSTFIGKYGVIFLVAILFGLNAVFMTGQPPPDLRVLAGLYLTINVSIILSAFWLDKKRK